MIVALAWGWQVGGGTAERIPPHCECMHVVLACLAFCCLFWFGLVVVWPLDGWWITDPGGLCRKKKPL